jgi:transposase
LIPSGAEAALRAQVRATPDATLARHCAQWAATVGYGVHLTTMWRALARLALTPQKRTLYASEQDPVARAEWRREIAALSPTGMGAAMLLEGAVDTAAFTAYIEQCLVPDLLPGQSVLMDNLSSHKSPAVEAAIEQAGCRLLFLPSYSPDYSPSEPALSKIKAFPRQRAARTQEALDQAIADALEAVTAQDARGWFAHCGYALPVAM